MDYINKSPGLYNIFSNIWLYFGYNKQEHDHILKKIKALHGINKLISIDDYCSFWISGISPHNHQGETFEHTIRQQMIIDKRTKLTASYNRICSQIDIGLYSNNQDSAPMVICIYTLNPALFECIIGLYLYYLNSRASMTLANAARSLSSKISGVEYQMTEEMKQYLFLTCVSST